MKATRASKLETLERIDAMEVKELEGPPPIVFHFQPDTYKVYETPAQLREWEMLMKELVGLQADISNLCGTCTESCSCCRTDDCDQD